MVFNSHYLLGKDSGVKVLLFYFVSGFSLLMPFAVSGEYALHRNNHTVNNLVIMKQLS